MRFVFYATLFLCVGFNLPVSAEISEAQSNYNAADALSGDELKLAEGGLVHLEGVEQPFPDGKWRDVARELLKQLTKDREITIENKSIDRYGRLTGQIYIIGENKQRIWLQGEMLRQGLAFVCAPAESNDERTADLHVIESAARKAQTGIWEDSAYADTASNNMSDRLGRFAFVSGVVLDARRSKNMVYLNFSDDWRKDFTATIAAHDLRTFRDARIDPLTYQGKRIRVRGWIKRDYGPVIAVTDPSQIDIIASR